MAGMTARDLPLLAHADDVRVAPDGRHVVYTVTTVDTEANRYRTRIWLAAVDRSSPPRPLTAGPWADTLPRWSPDGHLLAFARDVGPDVERGVWIIPVDGPGEATRVCGRPDRVDELSASLGDLLQCPAYDARAVDRRVLCEASARTLADPPARAAANSTIAAAPSTTALMTTALTASRLV